MPERSQPLWSTDSYSTGKPSIDSWLRLKLRPTISDLLGTSLDIETCPLPKCQPGPSERSGRSTCPCPSSSRLAQDTSGNRFQKRSLRGLLPPPSSCLRIPLPKSKRAPCGV